MKLFLVLPFFLLTVLGLLTVEVKASTTTCLTTAGPATASISTTSSSDANVQFQLACTGYYDCGDVLNPYGPIKDWTVGMVTDMSSFTEKCTKTDSTKRAAFNPNIENWVSDETSKQTITTRRTLFKHPVTCFAILTHSFLLFFC